jgi:hypothetical protein
VMSPGLVLIVRLIRELVTILVRICLVRRAVEGRYHENALHVSSTHIELPMVPAPDMRTGMAIETAHYTLVLARGAVQNVSVLQMTIA